MEKAPDCLLNDGFDHNFVLNSGDQHLPAATLTAPESGRKLEVFTTEPGFRCTQPTTWMELLLGKMEQYTTNTKGYVWRRNIFRILLINLDFQP